ncbi:hypothetical protein Tco_0730708 [Tanacetum coccineum]
MPHESPLQSVHSLGRDEGSLTLNELTILCTSLSKKVEEEEEPTELVEDQGSGEKGEKEVSTVGTEHSTVIPEVSTAIPERQVYIRRSAEKRKEKEKKYPLTQEMISRMLNRRLEVDHQSEMGYELIRIYKVVIGVEFIKECGVVFVYLKLGSSCCSISNTKAKKKVKAACFHLVLPYGIKSLGRKEKMNSDTLATVFVTDEALLTRSNINSGYVFEGIGVLSNGEVCE